MKPLHEYETPETDEANDLHPAWPATAVAHARFMEQRLAACRDALAHIADRSSSTAIRRIARETLELTKP